MSFLPFDLLKTAGLIGWFYLCLYSVKRTHRSPLVSDSYRIAACFAALAVGPLLLIVLFIVDTVKKLQEGSLSAGKLPAYTVDSVSRRQRPVTEVVSDKSPIPFKVISYSGLGLPELSKKITEEPSRNKSQKPAGPTPVFIDLTRELSLQPASQSAEVRPPSETPAKPAITEANMPPVEIELAESHARDVLRQAIGHRMQRLIISSEGGGPVRVEAEKDGHRVRLLELQRAGGVRLIREICGLAELDAQSASASPVGSFFVEVGDRQYCMRVVCIPSLDGHHVSVHIIEPFEAVHDPDGFGLTEAQRSIARQKLGLPSGLILIAEPASRGKTELLYTLMTLPEVRQRSRFMFQMFADRILQGVTQVEMSSPAEYVRGIRDAMLAQAQVIAVDQVQDAETARAVVAAAQSGVLVLAGIYAESSEEALTRFGQWELTPGHFLNDVRLLFAVRQARRLCPACRQRTGLSKFQKDYLKERRVGRRRVFGPVGCGACDQTGFSGLVTLAEMLEVDDALVRRYTDELSCDKMVKEGRERLFHSLRRTGMRIALEGTTSLEEIKRISDPLEVRR